MKQLHPDFQGVEAKLEAADGSVIDLTVPESAPPIRVFNIDFIHDNLSFDDCHAVPILLLGHEDIKRQEELDTKRTKHYEQQRDLLQQREKKNDIETALENAKTSTARDIKQTLSIPNYDKTRLAPRIDAVAEEVKKHVLSDDLFAIALTTYRSSDKKQLISEKMMRFSSLPELTRKSRELFTRTVTGQTIKRLEDNPEIEQWVRAGRNLHEDRTTCEFCGALLPVDLLKRLSDHFSIDYENLMKDLDDLIQEVNAASSETIYMDDEARFYTELTADYTLLKKQLEAVIEKRAKYLSVLATALNEKKGKVFTKYDYPEITDPIVEISTIIDSINIIIQKHNQRTNEFEKKRLKALEMLEYHFAAQFVIDQQYSQKLQQIKELEEKIEILDAQLTALSSEIQNLELALSDATKGAEQINHYLSAYFGKNHLTIEVSSEKRFQIKRGDIPASNLSEGEKTAIAFAYFLTRLSDRSTALVDSIVIIDDPVSSLDTNHLFNTVALIKTKLSDCKQLIIMTHNYEFFNLIRDWFMDIENTSKNKQHKDLLQWRSFFVESVTQKESTIREIPWELISFKSEYHYLFSVLHHFESEDEANFSKLFNLPNITRRYMEALGGIMIPSFAGLRKKMKILFPDEIERERVWKFINYYSHNTTINRSLTIPDNSECKAIVASCLAAVRTKYKEHYDALVEAVS
jgi:wobble nucleotide-excising tRNase